jgi:hypothetical protein
MSKTLALASTRRRGRGCRRCGKAAARTEVRDAQAGGGGDEQARGEREEKRAAVPPTEKNYGRTPMLEVGAVVRPEEGGPYAGTVGGYTRGG